MSKFELGLGEFPTGDILQRAAEVQVSLALIEQLKGGSSLRFPYDTVKNVVDALLREIPFMGYPLNELTVFRGCISRGVDLPTHASRFSYRPLSAGSSWGRCNRIGSTVFYGALNHDTVFSELGPEIGETILMGRAKIADGKNLLATCIGEIDYVRRYGKALVGNQETVRWLGAEFASMSEEQRVRTWLVVAFFADAFSQIAFRNKDYKITCALSEILFEPNKLEGFVYPSVAHRGGLNLAIRPEAFDEKFAWVDFEAIRVIDYLGFGLYARAPIATGRITSSDNSIEWTQVETPKGATGGSPTNP